MKKIISIFLTLALICFVLPFTVYASDNYFPSKWFELDDLYCDIYYGTDIQGELMPYSDNSFDLLNTAMDNAEELLSKDSDIVSDSECQECIDNLIFAYENMCIDVYYAKETYVLSLNEHNKNCFYDEADWNDFTQKRDALRDSFKTNDEYIISDAYFALQDSFINMTSGYKSGDINNDGKVSIDDATLIQKYLASIEDLTQVQLALATNISNGSCWLETYTPTIDCVTYLQNCIAGTEDIYSGDFSYGTTYTDCYKKTYNSMISLAGEFRDDRYEAVDAKVAELETEGII